MKMVFVCNDFNSFVWTVLCAGALAIWCDSYVNDQMPKKYGRVWKRGRSGCCCGSVFFWDDLDDQLTCLNLFWLVVYPKLLWNFVLLERSSFSAVMVLMMNINRTAGWNFRLGPKFLIRPFFNGTRSAQNGGLRILQVCRCIQYVHFIPTVVAPRAFEKTTSTRLCIVTMVIILYPISSFFQNCQEFVSSLPLCILSTTSVSHCFSIEANIELWTSAADSAGSCTKETTTEDTGCGDLFLGKKLRMMFFFVEITFDASFERKNW